VAKLLKSEFLAEIKLTAKMTENIFLKHNVQGGAKPDQLVYFLWTEIMLFNIPENSRLKSTKYKN